jgi:hypothetical protein
MRGRTTDIVSDYDFDADVCIKAMELTLALQLNEPETLGLAKACCVSGMDHQFEYCRSLLLENRKLKSWRDYAAIGPIQLPGIRVPKNTMSVPLTVKTAI